MKKILLFDIDGTLIYADSALFELHRAAFIYALKEVYKTDVAVQELKEYEATTDMLILRDLLKGRGFDDNDISSSIVRMFQSMARYFNEHMEKKGYKKEINHDVAEVLDQLNSDRNYVLGLVTGGAREISRMKLESIGIWHYFKIGGFGDSADSRAKLIDVAVAQAIEQKLVKKIDMRRVYVIGDTRRDIMGAKERGAVSVAVSTGNYSKEFLKEYNPDYLISRLSELIPILNNKDPK